MERLAIQMPFNTENAALIWRAIEPFFQTGNEIWRRFGGAINTDDIQPTDDFIIGIIMHEVILRAFTEEKVQGRRIAAVHGNDQKDLFISLHLFIETVNVI